MSDQPFNWNLPPKKPEDAAEPAAPQQPDPPQWAAAPPPVAAPPAAAQPPAPTWPPAQQPPAQAAPPPAWQPTQPPAQPPAQPQWPAAAATQPPAQPTQPPAQPAPPPVYQAPPPTHSGPAFPTGSYGFTPTQQQPTAPPVVPPRPNYEDVPTQAIAYDPFATQAFPFDGALSGATEVLGAVPVGLPELRDESLRPPSQSSAIDSLFGESQFKEYEASAFPSEGISALASTRERQPREPLGTTQKVLLWVAGGLVAVLALVGLFFAGTKLSVLFPPEPEVEAAAPAASAVPAQPVVLGPVVPGTYAWGDLLGTECLDPYVSAWQESYTVVDCTAPHAAQMVFHGYFGDEAWAPYPGTSELQSRINLLCTSPTTVNYSVASQFSDIQVAASYAATEDEWNAGQRDYFCFVSRSSLEPMSASVANAVVPVEGLTATVPGNDP